MGRPARRVGDSHNFGRRVEVQGGLVHKPRTLAWEWLLLSAASPLRRLLAAAASAEGLGNDWFGFLPDLRFVPSPPRGQGGAVEQLSLRPVGSLGANGRRELAAVVGRSLALWSFLGVADLHWENLVLGRKPGGGVVFAPLDIELVLADLSLPTETKLLPDADPEYAAVCRHASGVRRILPYLGKPVRPGDLLVMAAAYRTTLALLERHAAAIGRVFASLPWLSKAPIRVCLRGTDEYVSALEAPPWPPLLEAEQRQLARGDIPYFFRLYGEKGIRYYADRKLRAVERLPLRGDVPRLEPLLAVGRGLAAPSRRTLATEGLLVLLGAFDHRSCDGVHENAELRVTFRPRSLLVRFADGEELQARRNLSAFVGSVYLPCRCGEVRSVFVPPVTRCEAVATPGRRQPNWTRKT